MDNNSSSLSSILPDEIITMILTFLPVISLFRFKCVSKSWLDHITSPHFIKSHLNQSLSPTSKNQMLLVGSQHNRFFIRDFSDSPPPEPSSSTGVKELHPVPERFDIHGLEIGGSCKGLVCLYSVFANSEIILMNPSTRVCKMLPMVGCIDHIGLGFDFVKSGFKLLVGSRELVKRAHDNNLSLIQRVMVYTLRTDTWTALEGYGPDAFLPKGYEHAGVLINSHLLHWIARDDPETIICFDVIEEQWGLVPLPLAARSNNAEGAGTSTASDQGKDISDLSKSFDRKAYDYTKLGELDGSLCLFGYKRGGTSVWIMKVYGVAESWTKLVDLSELNTGLYVRYPPLASRKKGRQLLLVDACCCENKEPTFYWYDLRENTMEAIAMEGIPSFRGAILCLDTLVPLPGGVRMTVHDPE